MVYLEGPIGQPRSSANSTRRMRTTGSALGRRTPASAQRSDTPRSEQPAGSIPPPVELAHRRLRARPDGDTDGALDAAMGKTTYINMRTSPALDNARSWLICRIVLAEEFEYMLADTAASPARQHVSRWSCGLPAAGRAGTGNR
jgi:hypothetical protein